MPLSEQEQRLLDEMERSLYHSDADDVTTVGRRGRANYTAIVIGVLAGVVGVVLLVVGVVTRLPLVGVLGFAVMFAGALFAIAPPRRFRIAREVESAGGRPHRGFMDSLGDRWERRAEGGDDRER
jgi:hypothetical protein